MIKFFFYCYIQKNKAKCQKKRFLYKLLLIKRIISNSFGVLKMDWFICYSEE